MAASRANQLRFLPAIVTGVLVLALVVGLILLIRDWMASKPNPTKPVAQEVRIIRPPPPPPDVKPPPPPPPEEEVDVPEPEPQPDAPTDEAPPGDQLGLDAEGTAGGDGFGLVGRKGGRDLLASGGSAYAWYAKVLQAEILRQIEDDTRIRRGSFSISVRFWLRADGSVERFRLAQSTGNAERDAAIESALGRIQRFSQAPPPGTPQPVSLRIVSRA